MLRTLAAAVALLLLASPAAAQTFPKFTGLVVDAANVLPPEQEAALTTRLTDLQRTTGTQFVVATIPDLEGRDIADYGYQLGRSWAVGLKDADNGAILIVAPNDRKVRIEVGYGLEPKLTDALSSVIINERILPRFKAGDIPGGIVAGADAVADQLALPDEQAQARVAEATAAYDRTHRSRGSGGGGVPVGLIFWGIILAFVLIPMLARAGGGRRKAGPWGTRYRGDDGGVLPIILWGLASGIGRGGGGGGSSGGGWGGGGFSGGGGGSFGGGGASGSW